MKLPSSTASRRRPRGALTLASLFLLTSCVYVRVRGNPDWVDDVIHDSQSVPASYVAGDLDLGIEGFFWDYTGELSMNFACDPGDLDRYATSVRTQVERKIQRSGGKVTRVEETGPYSWLYEFEDDGNAGRAEIAIQEQPENTAYPYRLEITWEK